MPNVLFIQHGDVDKPGLLAEILLSEGIGLHVVHPYQNADLPHHLLDYDGLALGGGGQSAYELEKYPYLRAECDLVRQALAADKPILGLCLGAQIMAQALGAKVYAAPRKELGFFPVTMHSDAAQDEVLSALPARFPATHWHGDTFALPAGSTCLGSSAMTPHQIIRYGKKAFGFQFHLEMTPALFEELVLDAREDFSDAQIDSEALILEARQVLPALEPHAREVFRRWTTLL
jgi:GMP synthase (glutamine-hydrolysing)